MHRYRVQPLQSRCAKILRKAPERSSASHAAGPTAHLTLASQRSLFLRRPRVGCIRGFYWIPLEKSWVSPVPSLKAEQRPRLEAPIQCKNERPWDLLVRPRARFVFTAKRSRIQPFQSWRSAIKTKIDTRKIAKDP